MGIKKINPGDPESASANVVEENVKLLKRLFPELVTEGEEGWSVNVDVLKQLVGDRLLTDADEKYGLNWFGKRRARQLALTPSTGTLRPAPEESEDWDTTQNLFIEGDNLEVLKLLQKSYAGKVKLIYIDPPYNTGKDSVYKDDFRDNIRNYKRLTGQVDEEGSPLTTNTETSGRYHTDWLNMMYPRLKLAHSMLKQDGAIFVSCDEAEQPRLRLVMDEIFGEENFVADMVWAAGRKNDSRLISVSHEYIVCYVRDAEYLKEHKVTWRQRKKGLEAIYAQYKTLQSKYGDDYEAITRGMKDWFKSLPENHPAKAHRHYHNADGRGVFFAADISSQSGSERPRYEIPHPVTGIPVAVPKRGWGFTLDTLRKLIDEERVLFGKDHTTVPKLKAYLRDREYQSPYSVFYQDGRAATKRLRELMGEAVFDFPKDESIMQEIIAMVSSNSDIVMDFFAGSGTTAHAVMAQNAKDGGSRRYILVQLPEPLDPQNKEQKTAAEYCDRLGKPRNIAELAKERLRRAAEKVKEEHPEWNGDTGFRVFKLDSSNIKSWNPQPEDLERQLEDMINPLLPDRTPEDVLYELLLKLGLDLYVPIEVRELVGKTIYSVGGGVLMTCLDKDITTNDVERLGQGIVSWRKELAPAAETTVVFLDSAFENDVAKANLVAILEQGGITNIRSL